MLSGVYEAFLQWPWGYGAGNAITAVEVLKGDVPAGNLHNVFAQVLLDYGLQGLLLWLLVIAQQFRRLFAQAFECPLGLFICLYFILSLAEFTGMENFFWLILGAFAGYSAQGNWESKEKRSSLPTWNRAPTH